MPIVLCDSSQSFSCPQAARGRTYGSGKAFIQLPNVTITYRIPTDAIRCVAESLEAEMAVKKVTVNLPDGDLATLKRLAEDRGISVTQALRQAISTERFLTDETEQKGYKLILEKEGDRREVILKR
jgi:hypothetical protein